VLANATCVFTDPDVPAAVLNVVGSALGPAVGPAPAPSGGADGVDTTEQMVAAGPDIRPALGEPAEVAKILIAEARSGADVVRLVAGDPLSVDSVITEVNAVSRTSLAFDIVPGLPATVAVPTYAGLPLGSTHTVADVRGEVDWAALAAAPGPLILTATVSHLAEAARTLIENRHAIDFRPWAELWRMDYRLVVKPEDLAGLPAGDVIVEVRPDAAQTEEFWAAWA
jgi:uroporphyrinogen III methyltransferase/synthase